MIRSQKCEKCAGKVEGYIIQLKPILQRSYKDKEGEWQNTEYLRVNDIPKAILALQKAWEKIVLKE